MSFDWKKVGEKIADVAPMLGTLLGGPVGGTAGVLVSNLFGTKPEPDAVLEAISKDPQYAMKLKELELTHKLELERLLLEGEKNRLAAETQQMQEETKQIESVNQTMRVEATSEKWWVSGWRPYWGFITGTAFGGVCAFICYLAGLAVADKDHEAIRMIPDLVTSFAELFAIPGAILGITAWHRGKKQRLQAGEPPAQKPTLLDRVLKR